MRRAARGAAGALLLAAAGGAADPAGASPWGPVWRVERDSLELVAAGAGARALRAMPRFEGALGGGEWEEESAGILSAWGDDAALVVSGQSLGPASRAPWPAGLQGVTPVAAIEARPGLLAGILEGSPGRGAAPGGALAVVDGPVAREEPLTEVRLFRGGDGAVLTEGGFSRPVRGWGVQVAGGRAESDRPLGGGGNRWNLLALGLRGRAREWPWELRLRSAEGTSNEVKRAHGLATLFAERTLGDDARLELELFRFARDEAGKEARLLGAEGRFARGREGGAAELRAGAARETGDGSEGRAWTRGAIEVPGGGGLAWLAAAGSDVAGDSRPHHSAGAGFRWDAGGARWWLLAGRIERTAAADSLLPREAAGSGESWLGGDLIVERAAGDRPRAAGAMLSWRRGRGEGALAGGGTGGPGIAEFAGFDRMTRARLMAWASAGGPGGGLEGSVALQRVRGHRAGGGEARVPWEPPVTLRLRAWSGDALAIGGLALRAEIGVRALSRRAPGGDYGGVRGRAALDSRFSASLLPGMELYARMDDLLDSGLQDRAGRPSPGRHHTLGFRVLLRD